MQKLSSFVFFGFLLSVLLELAIGIGKWESYLEDIESLQL